MGCNTSAGGDSPDGARNSRSRRGLHARSGPTCNHTRTLLTSDDLSGGIVTMKPPSEGSVPALRLRDLIASGLSRCRSYPQALVLRLAAFEPGRYVATRGASGSEKRKVAPTFVMLVAPPVVAAAALLAACSSADAAPGQIATRCAGAGWRRTAARTGTYRPSTCRPLAGRPMRWRRCGRLTIRPSGTSNTTRTATSSGRCSSSHSATPYGPTPDCERVTHRANYRVLPSHRRFRQGGYAISFLRSTVIVSARRSPSRPRPPAHPITTRSTWARSAARAPRRMASTHPARSSAKARSSPVRAMPSSVVVLADKDSDPGVGRRGC
jgi:hypothetical protein